VSGRPFPLVAKQLPVHAWRNSVTLALSDRPQ